MSNYETWSLTLTGLYYLLTFGLLLGVTYQAIIVPRKPRIALYLQRMPQDTKMWSWKAFLADFVLENRGPVLRNITITSKLDFLGWNNFGDSDQSDPDVRPKATSEYFGMAIPFLNGDEKKAYFWCDMIENKEVVQKPLEIIVEFDNPVFFLPKRLKRSFNFEFSGLEGPILGHATPYNIHNVAEETARIC
ncbi:MAG TPA: hypothetical protein VGI80_03160 [Pyrinomonadaceae bacterium]|jgi:hypothetical protein